LTFPDGISGDKFRWHFENIMAISCFSIIDIAHLSPADTYLAWSAIVGCISEFLRDSGAPAW
jgi:glycerol uptake facilitator-like aquaporin